MESTVNFSRYPVISFTFLALLVLILCAASAEAAPKFANPATSFEDAGYEYIDQANGVEIFFKDSKKIVHVAARGDIDAEPARIAEILLDYDGQQGRVKRVSESRILRRGENWMLVYQHLNLPVISDRDYTLLVKWGTRNGVTWIAYKAVADQGPAPTKGLLRVTKNWGLWQLVPLPGGRGTEVRFQTLVDMGGMLPYWLVRPGTAAELPELYDNLRAMLN